MNKAIVLVLDSLGIGASADAALFGDTGADTLRHIAQACVRGEADGPLRRGPLSLPNLGRLGLGAAAAASGDGPLPGNWGRCADRGLRSCTGAILRQRYAVRALGNDGRTGVVRLGLFRATGRFLSAAAIG